MKNKVINFSQKKLNIQKKGITSRFEKMLEEYVKLLISKIVFIKKYEI